MKWVSLCALILGLALTTGCGQGANQKQTPEQLEGRLGAASAVTDPDKRNESLKVVAEDAADVGVGDVVRAAAEKITDPDSKNDVARTCALKLAKRGDMKAATAVAGLITDPDTKNDVLGKISNAGR
jgi:hypothetical protein